MSSDTTEKALEACIEAHLSGALGEATSSDVSLQTEIKSGYSGKGYVRGNPADDNAEFAIDEVNDQAPQGR